MATCKHGLTAEHCAFCREFEPEQKERRIDMTEEVTSRECTKCKKTKGLDYFSRSAKGPYGRKSSCKQCDAELFQIKQEQKKKAAKPSANPKEKIASGADVVKKLMEKTAAVWKPENVMNIAPIDPVPGQPAQTKADEHWAYIKQLFITHGDDADPEEMAKIEFHYKTAFVHGYKHGQTDSKHELR
jgi:hypothetical protein